MNDPQPNPDRLAKLSQRALITKLIKGEFLSYSERKSLLFEYDHNKEEFLDVITGIGRLYGQDNLDFLHSFIEEIRIVILIVGFINKEDLTKEEKTLIINYCLFAPHKVQNILITLQSAGIYLSNYDFDVHIYNLRFQAGHTMTVRPLKLQGLSGTTANSEKSQDTITSSPNDPEA